MLLSRKMGDYVYQTGEWLFSFLFVCCLWYANIFVGSYSDIFDGRYSDIFDGRYSDIFVGSYSDIFVGSYSDIFVDEIV